MRRTIEDIEELIEMIQNDYKEKARPYTQIHEYALEICGHIRESMMYGRCQYDAIIDTHLKHGYPLKDVLTAWKIRSYDDFVLRQMITKQLILLLKDMGFGPRQIYNKIDNYTPFSVMYYADVLNKYSTLEQNILPLYKNLDKKLKPTATKRLKRTKS